MEKINVIIKDGVSIKDQFTIDIDSKEDETLEEAPKGPDNPDGKLKILME